MSYPLTCNAEATWAAAAAAASGSAACGDKRNRIQVACSMQTAEQAPLQSSERNFISSSMCRRGSQPTEACRMIPTEKKGNKEDAGNYSPISLTSVPGHLWLATAGDKILG